MRVLSQAEIDAMLAKILTNPSILPEGAAKPEEKPAGEKKENETGN